MQSPSSTSTALIGQHLSDLICSQLPPLIKSMDFIFNRKQMLRNKSENVHNHDAAFKMIVLIHTVIETLLTKFNTLI